jgi:hypothetical protein
MDNLAAAKLPPNAKNGTMASYGDDNVVMALFDDDYVIDEFKTEMSGSTVYNHYIKVKLEYPGNNLTTFEYRFLPEDGVKGNQWTHRFPRQWAAFKAQKEQLPEGTPIELWPPLSKGKVLELKAMKVHTVEQLASLTDATGPNMGLDWRKLRDMANAYLKPEIGQATISKLTREKEDQEARIRALEAQLSSLVNPNSEAVPLTKRRGRPPRQPAGE